MAVGGIDTEGIDVAARIGALGLDPLRFLYTKDDLERNLMIILASKIAHHKNTMDHNLAIQIANAVGQLFSRS